MMASAPEKTATPVEKNGDANAADDLERNAEYDTASSLGKVSISTGLLVIAR